MQTEIVAKFLDVNHEQIRVVLRQLDAHLQTPNRQMKRKNFDYPDARLEKIGGWVRLRDEGDKVTLSYKQLNDRTLHGTKEASIVVDNFETAEQLLLAIGLVQCNYQETKRESWLLGNVQIELDEWPWVKPFLEIEGHTEDAIKTVAKQLGLEWSSATYGSVEVAYWTEYDVTEAEVDSWPEITFGPVPSWLEAKRK